MTSELPIKSPIAILLAIIPSIFILFVLFSLFAPAAFAFEQSLDLNKDGTINDLDEVIIKKAIAGEGCGSTLSCDLTQDGKVDMDDYYKIDNYLYYQVNPAGPARGTVNLGTPTLPSPPPIYLPPTEGIGGGVSGGIGGGVSGGVGGGVGGGMGVPPEMIILDAPFSLHPGGTAILQSTDGFVLHLQDIEHITCLKAGSCSESAAHIEVITKREQSPRILTINEGESQTIGNYQLTLKDTSEDIHQTTFLVHRTGATPISHELDPVKILVGSPFKLKTQQTAYVEDSFKVTLGEIEDFNANSNANSKENSNAHVIVSIRGGNEFSFTIPLQGFVGFVDANAAPYTLTYISKADDDVGAFVVTKKSAPQIPPSLPSLPSRVKVTPGIPFKLTIGGTGHIFGDAGVEFSIMAIELPQCNGIDQNQFMHRLPHTGDADMPLPPTCTPGSITVMVNGVSSKIQGGEILWLNDRYSLDVRGVYGTGPGNQVVDLVVNDLLIPKDDYTHPSCPRFMPPPQDWCKGKEIPGQKDEHTGCTGPPQCIPENPNPTIPPGSDRDEHGCIGSAGYSWCAQKSKCIRQWEEPCENFPPLPSPDCVLWYDGCNTCEVEQGKITSCTERLCKQRENPRCLAYLSGKPPDPRRGPSRDACMGCYAEEQCFDIGIRLMDHTLNAPSFCDIDKTLSVQKKNSEACQNNYECQSNTCADSVCTSIQERLTGIEREVKEQRGIMDKILGFFKRFFGIGGE